MLKKFIKRKDFLKKLNISLAQYQDFINSVFPKRSYFRDLTLISNKQANKLEQQYHWYIQNSLQMAQERRDRGRATIADILLLQNPDKSSREFLLSGSQKRNTMIRLSQKDEQIRSIERQKIKITKIMLSDKLNKTRERGKASK